MKILIFLLLISFSVSAQMPDVLSGLAIQGTLTNQSLKSVGQGMSSLKKNLSASKLFLLSIIL